MRFRSLLALSVVWASASACTVPDIVFGDGGLDASVDASVGDDVGAGEAAGGDGAGGDASGDGASDGGGCGADACCGSIPCTGDCSPANCATCISKCGDDGGGAPSQCCVKQQVTCHPTSSNCP